MAPIMEMLGRHGGYILASYVATALILSGLVWQTLSRYRAAAREIAKRTGADHG